MVTAADRRARRWCGTARRDSRRGFWLAASTLGDNQQEAGAIGDWPRDYESLEELLAIPGSVAVVGTVTSVADTPPRSIVDVTEVLAGSSIAAGDAVTVRQFGIRDGADAWEFRDARLLDLGEHVLLVLAYDELNHEYRVAGGPHGHFTIEGSRIRHANYETRDFVLSVDHPDGHPLAILADELTLEEFMQRVSDTAPES